jgi:hypothetical protein
VLEGEPTWLAVFGPAESRDDRASPSVSFQRRPDGYRLDIHLGAPEHRPRVATSGDTAVVFDGLLLDRSLVSRALRSNADPPEETEAEFVLRAYLELGEHTLPLLRGVFVLIVWDGRRETALFARDPTGSHPLFFSREGGRLLAGASHGALLDLGGVPTGVDRVAVARWVLDGSMQPRRTFYERIERLPPGHVLTAAPRSLTIRRYWHPRDAAPTPDVTAAEAVDRLQELLDRAVTRYAALGPLGIFLSGGADSACVASSAAAVTRARALPDPLALSLVFPTPEANEESGQRAIAGGLGIPVRVAPLHEHVGNSGLLVSALQLTEQYWMPPVNPWDAAYASLATEAAALGCKVILSGEGGNDWFEADWLEAADLLVRLRPLELARLWSEERRSHRSGLRLARALLWDYGLRHILRDTAASTLGVSDGLLSAARARRFRTRIPGWAVPEPALRAEFAADAVESRPLDRRGSYRESAGDRRLDNVRLMVAFENHFLFSRRVGVLHVTPVCDPDLVASLFMLPSRLLNLGGRQKGLVRESVRRRAGERAAMALGVADVRGFFGALIRKEAPGALAVASLRRLSELGIVDESEFIGALRDTRLGSELSYSQAWQTLACEAWLASRIDWRGSR